MFDRSDLRAAVGANVLSADQASRLEAYLISRHDGHVEGEATGQENLRFLANFNDIFITMGLGILFVGLTTLVGIIATPSIASGNIMAGVISALIIGGAAWIMLEYFCGRRRLLLPSMALTLAFTAFVSLALTVAYATTKSIDFGEAFNPSALLTIGGELGVVSFLSALAAALAVYVRFRLPFALAVIAVSFAGAVYTFLGFYGNLGLILSGSAFLIMGLITLSIAVSYDVRDPERIRKPSDNAFWLHLAAAPQVIWGVSTLVTGSNIFVGSTSGTDNASQGITLLCILLLIAVVSLALNRRALIAASLITFIAMLSYVLDRVGLDASNIFIMVTILIGSGVVLLGAGWSTARRLVLAFFPRGRTWNRLFPPEPA